MESRPGDSERWQDIESRLDRVLDGDADSLLNQSLDALRSLTDESEAEIAPEKRFEPVDPAEDPNSQFSEVMQNLTRMGEDPTLPAHTVSAYPPSPYLGRPWSPSPRYIHPDGVERTGYVHEPGPGVPKYNHPQSPPRPARGRPTGAGSARAESDPSPVYPRKPKFSASREPEESSLLPSNGDVLWSSVRQPIDDSGSSDDPPEIASIFDSLVSRAKRDVAEQNGAKTERETVEPAAREPELNKKAFFSEAIVAPEIPRMVKPPEAMPADAMPADAMPGVRERHIALTGTNAAAEDSAAAAAAVADTAIAERAEAVPDAAESVPAEAVSDAAESVPAEAVVDKAAPGKDGASSVDVELDEREQLSEGSDKAEAADEAEADDEATAHRSEAERRVAKRFSRRRATPGSLASAGLLKVEPAKRAAKTTTRAAKKKPLGGRHVVPAGTTPNLVPKSARPKNAPEPDFFEQPRPAVAKAVEHPPAELVAERDPAIGPSLPHDGTDEVKPPQPSIPSRAEGPAPGLGSSRRSDPEPIAVKGSDAPSPMKPGASDTANPERVLQPATGGTPSGETAIANAKTSRRVRGQHAAQMPDSQPRTSEELAITLEEPRRGLGYVAGLALLLVGLAAIAWVLINPTGDDNAPAFQTESLPASLTEIDADIVVLSIDRCDEQGVGGTIGNSLPQQIFVDLEIRFVADSGVQFHNGTLQSQAIDPASSSEYSFNYVESLVPEELRGFDHRCEVEVTRASAAEG